MQPMQGEGKIGAGERQKETIRATRKQGRVDQNPTEEAGELMAHTGRWRNDKWPA